MRKGKEGNHIDSRVPECDLLVLVSDATWRVLVNAIFLTLVLTKRLTSLQASGTDQTNNLDVFITNMNKNYMKLTLKLKTYSTVNTATHEDNIS